MSFKVMTFTLAVLSSIAVRCRTGDVKIEQKTIDGIAVKVTSSTGGKREWTRFDTAQPIPIPRGGVIPQDSMMRRPGFHVPIADKTLRAFVLKENTTFGEVSCRGFFEFDTYFDANWNLRICPLKGEHLIDGVPCMGTSVSSWRESQRRSRTDPSAVFYPSGKLQQCIAARKFERHGISYEEWDVVRLLEDGAPER